uniref:NADH dehydrogenase subunit 6 n=1 Tax=Histeromerus sp. QL-2013 TaxID=1421637 RepID=A0A0A6ZKL3_9HYME|nr:NADH dehydrogenase subunit 6 [Histeromerus sp. QL-2013]
MKNFEFNLIFLMVFLDLVLMFLMIFPSNLYKFHPLTLSMLLVLYTIINSFKIIILNSSYWYSYILFLVMIGGLMILFMYFTSLAMNQLFYFNLSYNLYMFIKIIIMIMILVLYLSYFDLMNYLLMNYLDIFNYMNMNMIYIEFKNLMMDYSMDLNLFMIIYLFFTMICSVMICLKFMLPMRQFKKMK